MSNPWIKAIRLRTLPLAWASLTLGATLAYMGGHFEWSIYVLSLLTAFSLQIASNLANDYGDASSGLDGAHREGPARTVQSGLISKSQMMWAIILACLFSLGFGLWLVYSAFIDWIKIVTFVVLGLGAIIASLKYTIGKKPYGYSGWGDVFVLVFFGWVGVGGSFYLYTAQWDAMVLLPASSLGLMAVAVLNVNNIRDIESDKKSGKYSIPVRIGRENAVLYHGMILLFSQLFMVAFSVLQNFSGFQWIFLLVVPLLRRNWVGVRSKTAAMELDPFLKQMAIATLIYVMLFALGNFVNGFA